MRPPRSLCASGAVAFLLGCVSGSPAPADTGCGALAASPELHTECIRLDARRLAQPAAAARCAELDAVEAPRCRADWAMSRLLAGRDVGDSRAIKEMCGADPDCIFRWLDEFGSRNVIEAVRECESEASRFAKDCVGHALERWSNNPVGATPGEVNAQLGPRFPEQVGSALARMAYCAGARATGRDIDDSVATSCTNGSTLTQECLRAFRADTASQPHCGPRPELPPSPGPPATRPGQAPWLAP